MCMHCRSPHPSARYWAKGSAIQFILHVLVTIVLVVIIVASMSTACTTGSPSAYPQCPGTSDNGATCSSSSSCKSGVCRGGNCTSSVLTSGAYQPSCNTLAACLDSCRGAGYTTQDTVARNTNNGNGWDNIPFGCIYGSPEHCWYNTNRDSRAALGINHRLLCVPGSAPPAGRR